MMRPIRWGLSVVCRRARQRCLSSAAARSPVARMPRGRLAGAGVADVGQGRQAVAGRFVQGGQGVDAGGAQAVDSQRGAVWGGYELDVSGEVLGLAGVPQVGVLLGGPGDAVAGDQGAGQDDVTHPLGTAPVQDVV